MNAFCPGKRLKVPDLFSMPDVVGTFTIWSSDRFKKDPWLEWLDDMGTVVNFGEAITVEQKREVIKKAVTASHALLLKMMRQEMTPDELQKFLVDVYLFGRKVDDTGT